MARHVASELRDIGVSPSQDSQLSFEVEIRANRPQEDFGEWHRLDGSLQIPSGWMWSYDGDVDTVYHPGGHGRTVRSDHRRLACGRHPAASGHAGESCPFPKHTV